MASLFDEWEAAILGGTPKQVKPADPSAHQSDKGSKASERTECKKRARGSVAETAANRNAILAAAHSLFAPGEPVDVKALALRVVMRYEQTRHVIKTLRKAGEWPFAPGRTGTKKGSSLKSPRRGSRGLGVSAEARRQRFLADVIAKFQPGEKVNVSALALSLGITRCSAVRTVSILRSRGDWPFAPGQAGPPRQPNSKRNRQKNKQSTIYEAHRRTTDHEEAILETGEQANG